MPSHAPVRVVALALAAIVALGSCSSDDDAAPPSSTPGSSAPPMTDAPASDAALLDWVRGNRTIELTDGWTLGPCESGPRQLCLRNATLNIGGMDLLDYPVSTLPEVAATLDAGGTHAEALAAHVESFERFFLEDREAGCPEGYEVRSRQLEAASFGGTNAVAYGFDATQDGEPVERVLAWAAIKDDSLFIFSVNAMEVGTCGDDAHIDELDLEQLAMVEDVLRAVAANSPLPEAMLCADPSEPGTPIPCEALDEQ